jgi:hypothetical protein
MSQPIHTFEEFWPLYVRAHSKALTRKFHFVGTTLALACVAGGLVTKRRWLLLLAPAAGYGPAWFSHFFVERNTPETFRHPFWSLRADFVMWTKMIEGTMDAEVERVLAAGAVDEVEAGADPGEIRPNMATDGTLH